ncbi:MAG: hypothetical protein RBU21_08735 [FCB group bacterium]|jgi:hypothetical protein|nr:hypothetical protein [FCB group bacterium]
MSTLLIEIDGEFRSDLDCANAIAPGSVTFVDSDKIEGTIDIVQALLALSGIVVPVVGKVVIEAIRSRRHVVIRKNGIVVTGVTADSALRVLKELSDDN